MAPGTRPRDGRALTRGPSRSWDSGGVDPAGVCSHTRHGESGWSCVAMTSSLSASRVISRGSNTPSSRSSKER
eukprot:2177836-Heterocapsa_arctica.AAC.1